MIRTTIAKLIRWSGVASIIGSLIGCARVFLKEDIFALWGMSRIIDPVLSIALVLWSLGLMGFWSRHAYTGMKSSLLLRGLAGGIFAFYGASLPSIMFGDPTGHPIFFAGIAIIGGFCIIWRKLGKWTVLPLLTVTLGLCSWIPAFALYLSEAEPSYFLRMLVIIFAFLFNLSWAAVGYALWVNTKVPKND